MNIYAKVLFTLALTCAASPAVADTLTLLGLDGNGDIEGAAGQIVGYGFDFSVPVDYAILNFSEFTPPPSIADYTDYLASNFVTTAPGSPADQTFSDTVDPLTGVATETGLGQFEIHAGVPVGTVITGLLTLDYDLYSVDPNDPNFDPTTDGISYGNEVSVTAGLQVTAPVAAAPEPGTFVQLAIAAVLFGSLSQLRRCSVAGKKVSRGFE